MQKKTNLLSIPIDFHECYITVNVIIEASQVALVINNTPANAGGIRDMGLIPGLGRSPGGGHGNPFQYSYLENPHGQGEPGKLQSMGSPRVRHG